ncbi:MAG: PQQ-dependent sugar dehydrogenase, partial [Nitrospiraceae bacterium]
SGGGTTTPPATVAITSPSRGASLPVGSVLVTFTIQNSPVGPSATQPRMHFYVDSDPIAYKFYDGPGIVEEGNLSGVRYQGVHTHFVHWKSSSSFAISGLSSGLHKVRFVLTDANDKELTNTEANKTLNFLVEIPPAGDLQLERVLTGLDSPVGLSLAPDGRVFYNERRTGNIRIIDPGWQLNPTPFCHIDVATAGFEQGLLGLTLDPGFANNHFVYVYYTARDAATPGSTEGTVNRVVRYTESSGQCVLGSETVIIDDIPMAHDSNGGILQFGPDGKLYVVTGDAELDGTTLAGKFLRVNPDGTVPVDNPFSNSNDAKEQKVFSYGHRNSYGFTFHPHTGDLWETENGVDDNDEINRIVAGGNYGWDTGRGEQQRTGILHDPCCIDPIAVFFANPPCDPTNPGGACVIVPTGIIAIPNDTTVYPDAYRNNLLFVDYSAGKIRRIILGGADLTQLGTLSVAYNGGNGGLISLMLGADGYVYVSSFNGEIFRVKPI